MYKVGIIGCGGISGSHYQGFADTGEAEVTRAYDILPEAMAEKAEAWGARTTESGKALIESDVDIVVISSPGFAHREYVEMAAAAGKAIICEKPIALNMQDALAMKDAVEDTGVPFMVAFTQRYDAPLVQLKTEQDTGRVGEVVSAWAQLYAPASTARWLEIERTGHWRSSMELSGGRINEFCSHSINWLLWVLGRPKTVYGRALYVTEGFDLDDADCALIECERGTGLLHVHRHAGVANYREYGIQGHGGSVTLRDGAVQLKAMDADPEPVTIQEDVPTKHAHFLACLESSATPRTNIDDAIDTLRVCLAFNKSAESGRVEAVAS